MSWEIEAGDWDVVVMNADASPDVTVEVSAGIRAATVLILVALS